jgi:hypothetical protein
VPRRHDERVDHVSLPCLSPVESVVMRDTPMILVHILWITLWVRVCAAVDNRVTRR